MQVRLNELSQRIDSLIIKVEEGESCIILKEGIPIAKNLPFNKKEQGWKRTIDKLKIPIGISAQKSQISTINNQYHAPR